MITAISRVRLTSTGNKAFLCHHLLCNRPIFVILGGRTSSLSSSSSHKHSKHFQLDALPFSVSPDDALASFDDWARHDQGLRYILRPRDVQVTAAFCPVWSFDLNVRFSIQSSGQGNQRDFSYKPPVFEIYGNRSVIHLPGLSSYSGYTYRRSLVDPLHNTTLMFLGRDQTQPFGQWMLRDMYMGEKSNAKVKLSIFPDPWNTSKSRARSLLVERLQGLAVDRDDVTVETQVVQARRVYMPTYVIDYKVLNISYQAFLSGCDKGAGVSGVSHQVMWSPSSPYARGRQPPPPDSSAIGSFLSQAWGWLNMAVRTGSPEQRRQTIGIVAVLGQSLVSLATRFLFRLAPFIGAATPLIGLFVGVRKIVQPWWTQYESAADWERQREHEAATASGTRDSYGIDDFEDTMGAAQRHYSRNRQTILNHLAGGDSSNNQKRERGEYDWYQDWEAWARQQWEQQQQTYDHSADDNTSRHRSQQNQQQSRQRQQARRGTSSDYQWDFDKNDPYSVLSIPRDSSKKQVSAAFRKEMLKWHPDAIEPGASDALRARATERSKLITGAYQKIKAGMRYR